VTEPVLVLGLGNELFTDEGLGIEAARRIEALGLGGVEVADGGTLGLDLVPTLADRQSILVLDAVVAAGAEPGTIVVLDDSTVRSERRLMMSAHQLGLSEALAAADLWGRGPEVCAAVGMVPFSLDTGFGLSEPAEDRLDLLIASALDYLAEWGVEVPADA
jgi:hydrogenase maturation protease